jgi:polyisoprenoid-binding protein YceI
MRSFLLPVSGLLAAGAALLLWGAPVQAQDPTPAPAGAKTYTLNAGSSELYAQVFKDASTIAAGLSHDHVVVANSWTGTATWDPANIGACKVSITVPVSGLKNDDPSWRTKVGFTSMLSDSQIEEVKGHMVGSGQLNAASYSTMTFTATACAAAGDKVNVTGNLGIHGVSKSVTLPMKITADASSFSASGVLSINQSDYGITPFSALGGALKNQDSVRIVVKVKGS